MPSLCGTRRTLRVTRSISVNTSQVLPQTKQLSGRIEWYLSPPIVLQYKRAYPSRMNSRACIVIPAPRPSLGLVASVSYLLNACITLAPSLLTRRGGRVAQSQLHSRIAITNFGRPPLPRPMPSFRNSLSPPFSTPRFINAVNPKLNGTLSTMKRVR